MTDLSEDLLATPHYPEYESYLMKAHGNNKISLDDDGWSKFFASDDVSLEARIAIATIVGMNVNKMNNDYPSALRFVFIHGNAEQMFSILNRLDVFGFREVVKTYTISNPALFNLIGEDVMLSPFTIIAGCFGTKDFSEYLKSFRMRRNGNLMPMAWVLWTIRFIEESKEYYYHNSPVETREQLFLEQQLLKKYWQNTYDVEDLPIDWLLALAD